MAELAASSRVRACLLMSAGKAIASGLVCESHAQFLYHTSANSQILFAIHTVRERESSWLHISEKSFIRYGSEKDLHQMITAYVNYHELCNTVQENKLINLHATSYKHRLLQSDRVLVSTRKFEVHNSRIQLSHVTIWHNFSKCFNWN